MQHFAQNIYTVLPCNVKICLLTVLSLLTASTLYAQLTISVIKVPTNTPANAQVYMACNLNNWHPAHPDYLLQQQPDGSYALTLPLQSDTLRYKFTRGSWPSVEGSKIGKLIADRLVVGPIDVPTKVTARIQSWEDLATTSYYDIFIDRLPINTPANTQLFLTGNFNDWNPRDLLYQFQLRDDGNWHLRLPFMLDTLSFKITRGSWETVEGNERGEMITNREFISRDYTSMTIHTNVLGWEDLAPPRYFNFLVSKVPDNTPADASLYLCGTFNQWKYGDESYRLEKSSDGSYYINISSEADTVYYLFNRGSALMAECNSNGTPKQYRRAIYQNRPREIPRAGEEIVFIKAWLDLPTAFKQLYTTTLAVPFTIGVFLLALLVNQFKQKYASRMAFLALLCISFTLGAQLLIMQPWAFAHHTKLALLPFLGLLTIPPTLYHYLLALLAKRHKAQFKDWLHTAPFAVLLVLLLPLLISSSNTINELIRHGQLNWVFALGYGIAFTIALVYCLASVKLWNRTRSENLQSQLAQPVIKYGKILLFYTTITLIIWASGLLLPAASHLIRTDTTAAANITGYIVWLLLGGYVGIIFTAMTGAKSDYFNFASNHTQKTEHFFLTRQIQEVMAKDKPYLNPKLTLNHLAQICHVNPQQMSRALNEGFGKNFYDYINHHRIAEFKQLVSLTENKEKTVLEMAYKVGFSSKTTFNRAFKKSTGQTPSEYLKTGLPTSTATN